jgi:hypothetical protein
VPPANVLAGHDSRFQLLESRTDDEEQVGAKD